MLARPLCSDAEGSPRSLLLAAAPIPAQAALLKKGFQRCACFYAHLRGVY